MRPLTIALLVTAVAACLLAALSPNRAVELASRLVFALAFVASITAFLRTLPRTPEPFGQAPRLHAGGRTACVPDVLSRGAG